jgi:hypothetical protein
MSNLLHRFKILLFRTFEALACLLPAYLVVVLVWDLAEDDGQGSPNQYYANRARKQTPKTQSTEQTYYALTVFRAVNNIH